MMKLRLAAPEYVIDIDALAHQLGYIREEAGEIRIGAMTRHRDLLESPLLRGGCDLHGRRTVIADPWFATAARSAARSARPTPPRTFRLCVWPSTPDGHPGRRWRAGDRHGRVPPRPLPTAVGAAEMLVEIRVPLAAGSGSAYEKVERRVGDWAVAAAGAALGSRTSRRPGRASRSRRSAATSPRRTRGSGAARP